MSISILIHWLRQLGGALVFYTILPLPHRWTLDFARIARWAPWIGLLLGSLLGGIDILLRLLQVSDLGRGVLGVAAWIGLTGGLHLDGAMDTADGLGVSDPERRLAVMGDSRTGAYGAIAGILLILLKVSVIADLSPQQMEVLWIAPIWGRWAQLWAIARYPYLKPDGKGAFHKKSLKLPQDWGPSIPLLIGISLVPLTLDRQNWPTCLVALGLGMGLSWGIGQWFNRQFQGMTGDIYGAIVEWTEVAWMGCFSLLTK